MERERRYWLFKSEPGCFSFEDLHNAPGMTEKWDGVRNYQARNLLRDEIKPGDYGFFYHSNIPQPAIVGVVEVVREGYADFTARDPEGEHFDPKSSLENPLWYMVDVRYVRPLSEQVTLEMIKNQPILAGMELVKRSRLSVQPVRREEWEYLLHLGGVAPDERG
jgi:predicted RNA-binding protein with PUA-like domain